MDQATSRRVVAFEVDGHLGRVAITCEPNSDPSRWGYELLGLDSPAEVARGFPVVRADVSVECEGYAAIMAWVQVVSIHDLATGSRHEMVDVAPQLQGLEVPYLAFGPEPALFDAPSTDAEEDRDWFAHSFLVASRDRVMTRRLVPLCGFAWGYRLRDQRPSAIAPVEIGAVEWTTARERLRADHPSWTFGSWRR